MKEPQAAQSPSFQTLKLAAICLGLVVLVLWGFLPSLRNDLVNYDDNEYVMDNTHVTSGLTLENARWAFRSGYAANWHPLTWVSHMLDCQLYGLKPWGHHLSSVLWHAVNTLLVFLIFKQMTGAVWRGAGLAALFAVHPLQVDTVAWVAERKNLLSTFFFLLAVWAYVRSVEVPIPKSKVQRRDMTDYGSLITDHRSHYYLLSLSFFALGLMCKQSVVVLPFVLLLLDYWPLERFKPCRTWPLVREKIPFFALAATASVVAFLVQQRGGAMAAVENLPVGARSGNALISYWRYLGKLFWPTDLAVFYPHPLHWPLVSVLLAGLSLLGISILAATQWKQRPYLPVGWFWFLGALVPVIGLVQVGGQAMANRYLYVPLIGLLLLLIWWIYDLTGRWRYQTAALTTVGAAAVLVCAMLTRRQVGYWENSESLFRHAIAITENNHIAHYNLSNTLLQRGRVDEAKLHFEKALQIQPGFADAHNNLGNLLLQKGQVDEAISHFQKALDLRPLFADARSNLGVALLQNGHPAEAIAQFQLALQAAPNDPLTRYNLGNTLLKSGRVDEAIAQFKNVLEIRPELAEARSKLGSALLKKGQEDEAIAQFRRAVQLNPNLANVQSDLGTLLLQKGRGDEAVAHYQAALTIQPTNALFLNNLAWVLATCPNAAVRNGPKAVELAQKAEGLSGAMNPAILGTLAAAYAEAGRFAEALRTAQHALDLAIAQTNSAQAEMLRANIALFRAGSPSHEEGQTNASRDRKHP